MKLWYSLVAHSAVKPSIKGSLTHGGLTQKGLRFFTEVPERTTAAPVRVRAQGSRFKVLYCQSDIATE